MSWSKPLSLNTSWTVSGNEHSANRTLSLVEALGSHSAWTAMPAPRADGARTLPCCLGGRISSPMSAAILAADALTVAFAVWPGTAGSRPALRPLQPAPMRVTPFAPLDSGARLRARPTRMSSAISPATLVAASLTASLARWV